MLRRSILFLPAIVALLIYLPSLRSDFVYDARAQILTDNYIHEPSHFKDVLTFRVLSQDVLDNDRPVHLAIYLTESLVWARNPFGYHLTSILFHSVNVLLLTLLITQWMEQESVHENAPQAGPLNLAGGRRLQIAAPLCAAVAAFLYAIHPVNVEAVAEPSFREDLLATFFTLSGLLLATRRASSSFSIPRSAFIIFLIPLCFFLGIASKENAIVGPPVLALHWLLFRRSESWKRWLVVTIASFASVLAFLIVYARVHPQHSHIFLFPPSAIAPTYAEIAVKQVRIYMLYCRNLVRPTNLSADYPITAIAPISQSLAWTIVVLFVLAELALLLQSRLHLLAAAIFWLGIATVSNFVPIYRPIADRFLYLPLTGIALHVALLLAPLARRSVLVVAIPAIVLACPLVYLNLQRQHVFHDSVALWTDTLRHNPDSFTAYDNLAFGEYDASDYSNAVRNWQQALKHATSRQLAAEAFAGLSIGLDALGNQSGADAAYQRAIELAPRFSDPRGLVDAIDWERPHAAALRKIVERNRAAPLLSF